MSLTAFCLLSEPLEMVALKLVFASGSFSPEPVLRRQMNVQGLRNLQSE